MLRFNCQDTIFLTERQANILKVSNGVLYVCEYGRWSASQHKDGVSMLGNGECVPLTQK